MRNKVYRSHFLYRTKVTVTEFKRNKIYDNVIYTLYTIQIQ
jgi:hypothetical protein